MSICLKIQIITMQIADFLRLEWQQFTRAAYFQKSLAIKILMGFLVLYFGGTALLIGGLIYFIAEDAAPNVDPLVTVNNLLVIWVALDLLLRYFLQQLPVLNVKPLMAMPVQRTKVVRFVLLKSLSSFFNILPLFLYIPFTVVLLANDYNPIQTLAWFVGVVSISFSINFTNFLINKNNTFFYALLALITLGVALNYFGVYDPRAFAGGCFYALFDKPYWVVVPLFVMYLLYRSNKSLLLNGFYLDDLVAKKVSLAEDSDFSWLKRFGPVAPFLENDIKLIRRNVRPRQVLLVSFMFLFYGLIFYTQDIYMEMPTILVFASIFVTGGFLMTFGQQVPSWDSQYYKLLMSQNIPYRQYLNAKWMLMVFGVLVSFVLSLPYLYFGWDIYAMIAAGALFNVGLNSFITLIGGALNRTPIVLNEKAKAFSNTSGFNPTQLLIGLPKIFMPMLFFYVPYRLISFDAGLICVALSGVLGLAFRSQFLSLIERIYKRGKHKTIAAFAQES